jgi:PAS domain S-box-containing protein
MLLVEDVKIETRAGQDPGPLDAAYLAAIVESSDDAIIGKDLSGIVRSWNRGAETIFGYTASEMIGCPVQRLFPPDRLAEEDRILARIRAGERVDHHETIRRRKDGSDFPVSITISPIRGPDGAIVGASKIVRDVSERHAAQAELQRAKADLEQVLIERTAALVERDLLLREVYHRVKNNLQVVDGLLTLQALKTQDPQAKQSLLGLRARVFALGLVHQQLMGSADLKTFDVAPFLEALLSNIIDGAAVKPIELVIDACPIEVGLDYAAPLGMLVTEIVTNALKHAFSETGGRISVALRPDDSGRLRLIVSDDGRGLSQDSSDPVREGLGTSIIQRLVSQLGGEIVMGSNVGTTVEVSLPMPEAS